MYELARNESMPIEQLRDKVIDDLVKHYSLERLSLDEFERRTELASKAGTRGELVAQVSDLPELPDPGRERREPKPAASSGTGLWRVNSGNARPNDFALAIFGGSDYKGVWQTPRNLTNLCIFGGTSIDLRRAVVPQDGVTISCLCIFGGVDVIIPPGMRVVVRGMGIFGGFDRVGNEVDDPYAPTVVVEGVALFGGVSVKIRA
jgi:hypothetical protein